MRLTRRDAIKALVAGGIVSGGGIAAAELSTGTRQSDGPVVGDTELATLSAVAEVVYPSTVSVTPEFVEAFVGRVDEARKREIATTISELNAYTQSEYGAPFHELGDRSKRDRVLRSMGVGRVQSVSDGPLPSRITFHLVNTLLYALFSTPKGSALFGIRNPIGYGGGFATYREQFTDA